MTDPSQLANLTPLVAVCVVFIGALTAIITAFLHHLNKKDERTAAVVEGVQKVLQDMQAELTRLAMNDQQQTAILQQMLIATLQPASQPSAQRTDRHESFSPIPPY